MLPLPSFFGHASYHSTMTSVDKKSLVLGGILLFAGYGIARSLTSCKPSIQPGDKLLLVGDSLGVGLSRHLKQLAAARGVSYDAMVQGSTTIRYWLDRIKPKLASIKPDLVLVCLGTNDSKARWSTAQHEEHVRMLLSAINSSGARPMWILPPRLPWQETVSDIVKSTGTQIFNSKQVDIQMGPDGIHPTGAGYAGWAGLIWQTISCEDNAYAAGMGRIIPAPPTNLGIFRRRS